MPNAIKYTIAFVASYYAGKAFHAYRRKKSIADWKAKYMTK